MVILLSVVEYTLRNGKGNDNINDVTKELSIFSLNKK